MMGGGEVAVMPVVVWDDGGGELIRFPEVAVMPVVGWGSSAPIQTHFQSL